MGTIFRSMILTSLRDKISLFYAIIFPIGLMIGIGVYLDSEAYNPLLLTGVIALSTLFWSVQGLAFQVHMQRGKGVYKLIKLSPYSTLSFIAIMTLVRTFLGTLINILILATGVIVFNLSLTISEWMSMVVIMVIGTLCFSCLGFFLSNFAKNEGQINMMSNMLYLPMVFASEAFYSLKNAPDWIVSLGGLFPFSYYLKAMRNTVIDTNASLMLSLGIVVAYTAVLLLLAALTFKWDADQQAISFSLKHRGKFQHRGSLHQ
jgi:ABC-2 type transport system permease protein